MEAEIPWRNFSWQEFARDSPLLDFPTLNLRSHFHPAIPADFREENKSPIFKKVEIPQFFTPWAILENPDFCISFLSDMIGMDADYKDLLRILEHQNQSDATWLQWQREGHVDGYPSIGIYWITEDGTVAIGEKTSVKLAKDNGYLWGPTLSIAKAWRNARSAHPQLKKLRRTDAPMGHVDYCEIAPDIWCYRIFLPLGITTDLPVCEQIRLAYHLPIVAAFFVPHPLNSQFPSA